MKILCKIVINLNCNMITVFCLESEIVIKIFLVSLKKQNLRKSEKLICLFYSFICPKGFPLSWPDLLIYT